MTDVPPIPPHDGYPSEVSSLRRARARRQSSAAGHVPPPALPDEPQPAQPEPAPEPGLPISASIGAVALAVVACIPHFVAPITALILALTGIPIAWSFRRISVGRRQRFFVAVTLVLVLTVALAIAMPLLYVELGVLSWPTLPDWG